MIAATASGATAFQENSIGASFIRGGVYLATDAELP
jgi:hypothetical protein